MFGELEIAFAGGDTMVRLEVQTLLNSVNCTGCGSCVNTCPVNAISLQTKGYRGKYPSVNTDLCTGCKLCVGACPILNEPIENAFSECYAVICDESFRKDCSSGGVFGYIAKDAIDCGATVYGASFENDLSLKCNSASNLVDLEPLLKSKYVMCDMGYTYREIKRKLDLGEHVIVCSTPCRIAGVRAYLRKEYDNLLLLDLVCHGAPSEEFFKKYVIEKYGPSIKNVVFRDKCSRSWGMTFTLVDGNGYRMVEGLEEYADAFLKNYSLSDCCFGCSFCKMPRQGDMTLGDFWGYSNKVNDGRGVSLVLANTEKGVNYIKNHKSKFRHISSEPINDAIKYNSALVSSQVEPKNRDNFLIDFLSHSLKESIRRADGGVCDVGLTIYSSKNYGNNLTNYSLYQSIRGLGKTVKIVCKNTFFNLFSKNPFLGCEIVVNDVARANETCSRFILGSDQTLAAWCIGADYFTCMPWVSDGKYIASYGASIGLDRFEAHPEYINRVKFLLSRFNHISVRERSAVNEIYRVWGLNADYVLDPIFLTERSDYEAMAMHSNVSLPIRYIGAYILDMDMSKKKLLDEVATSYGVSDVLLIQDAAIKKDNMGVPEISNASVEDLINLIKNADVFVTDSFHGACLSIILNKEFYIANITKSRGVGRLENLLSSFNLSNRWMKGTYSRQPIIDYISTNRILLSERERSLNYLIGLLNSPPAFDSQKMAVWFSFIKDLDQKITNIKRQNSIISDLIYQKISVDLEQLRSIKSLVNYLSLVTKKFVVLFSVCDDASVYWSTLREIIPEKIEFRQAFAAIVCRTDIQSKKSTSSPAIARSRVNKVPIKVTSEGFVSSENHGRSIFTIGNRSLTLCKRGLNIVVYSGDFDVVVDVLSIDLHVDPSGLVRRVESWEFTEDVV